MKTAKFFQKGLLLLLYALIVLMIVFSVMARKNLGEEGYLRCVEKKCQQKGEQFCSKQRELSNCCLGAGGVFSLNNVGEGDLKRKACHFD